MGNYLNKIIALFLIFSFLGLFLTFSLFWYFSNDLPDFGFLKTYKPPVSTKVYDIDGDVISLVGSVFGVKSHLKKNISELTLVKE